MRRSPPIFRRLFPPTNERLRQSQLTVAETFGKEHGRRVRRRLEVSARLTSGHLDHWPGAAQVCRLTRTTRRKPKGESKFVETVEIEYAISSVPSAVAGAPEMLTWWRNHWGIENRSHWVRDATLNEDGSPIFTGHAPQNLAAIRNAIVSMFRLEGSKNIAETLRNCAWQTGRLLARLGILKE